MPQYDNMSLADIAEELPNLSFRIRDFLIDRSDKTHLADVRNDLDRIADRVKQLANVDPLEVERDGNGFPVIAFAKGDHVIVNPDDPTDDRQGGSGVVESHFGGMFGVRFYGGGAPRMYKPDELVKSPFGNG